MDTRITWNLLHRYCALVAQIPRIEDDVGERTANSQLYPSMQDISTVFTSNCSDTGLPITLTIYSLHRICRLPTGTLVTSLFPRNVTLGLFSASSRNTSIIYDSPSWTLPSFGGSVTPHLFQHQSWQTEGEAKLSFILEGRSVGTTSVVQIVKKKTTIKNEKFVQSAFQSFRGFAGGTRCSWMFVVVLYSNSQDNRFPCFLMPPTRLQIECCKLHAVFLNLSVFERP